MWENFGGGKFWLINGSKVFGEEKFGESVGSLLKILAFINIGGENFGKLPTVRQIRQNFPPPNFSHVWYVMLEDLSNITTQTSCSLTWPKKLNKLDDKKIFNFLIS